MQPTLVGTLGAIACLALAALCPGGEEVKPPAPPGPKLIGGHTDPLVAARFSPDGSRLLTQDKGQAFLWDTETGAQLGGCAPASRGLPAVFIDNRRVAFGAHRGGRVLDMETGQKLLELEAVDKDVRSLAAAPDGKSVFGGLAGKGAGGKDSVGELVVWSLEDGKVLRRHVLGDSVTPKCMAFVPDGRSLVVSACLHEDAVLLVAADTGAVTARFRHSPWKSVSPAELACQPRGGLIAATSASDDGRHLRIWRPGSSEPAKVLTFEQSYSGSNSLAFSPDGAQLLTGESGSAGALRCWDMAGFRKIWTLPAHRGGVLAVAYAPGGKVLLTVGCDGTLVRRTPADGKAQQAFQLRAHSRPDLPGGRIVLAVHLTADGREAVSAGQDGTVRLWDLATGRELKRTLASRAVAPAASADRRRLLLGTDKSLTTWDIGKWAEAGKLDLPGQPRKLVATPGLDLAFVTLFRDHNRPDSKGTAFLIDVKQGGPIKELPELAGAGRAAFSDDGKLLAVGVGEAVQVFNAENGEPIKTVAAKGIYWESHDLAFSADGARLLRTTGDPRAPIAAWDTRTWQPAAPSGIAIVRRQFIVAPGGKRLGLAQKDEQNGRGSARVFAIVDLADGTKLTEVELRNHVHADAMDVSTDGRTVLAGLGSGQLEFWTLP